MIIDTRDDIKLNNDQRKIVENRIKSAVSCMNERQTLNDSDAGKFQTRSERNLALLNGTYWNKIGKKGIKQINYLRTAIEIKHGLVTDGDTEFLITARQIQFKDAEESTQAYFNNLWQAGNYDKQCDMAYYDARVHPVGGVVEFGWEYKDDHFDEYGVKPNDADIIDENVKDADEETVPPAFTAMGIPLGLPTSDIGEELPQLPEPEIDRAYVERFDSRDLLVDPACTNYDLTTARYAFRHKWALLFQVKANKQFRNTKELKGRNYLYWKPTCENQKPAGGVADDILRTELFDGYCYLDLGKGDQLYHVIFSGETNKELLCEPYRIKSFIKQNNPYPWEIMPAIVTDNDSMDMICDVEVVRDLQINHDLAYTQVEKARARSGNILVVPEELFDGIDGEERRRKIEKGEENVILPIPNTITNASVMQWLPRPPIHTDAYQELEAIPTKILGHIGVNEYQGNMLPNKTLTATESSQIAVQGSNRQQRETEIYYDFLKRVAYKVLLLIQEFTARPQEYTHTGIDGQPQSGYITPEILRGVIPGSINSDNPAGDLYDPGIQFDIQIDISKKQPRNQVRERQDLVALLRELAPVANMPDPRLPSRAMLDIPGLLRAIIKRFELTDIDNIIPPSPTDEEKQQYAMQMQQQQMAGDIPGQNQGGNQ